VRDEEIFAAARLADGDAEQLVRLARDDDVLRRIVAELVAENAIRSLCGVEARVEERLVVAAHSTP